MDHCNEKSEKGFTLVELLVALALAGIVSTAIYGSFISQEKVYKAQQLVAEMQQNARAAMLIATKEARMVNAYLGSDGAGYWDATANGGTGGEASIQGFRAYNDYEDGTDAIDIAYADFSVATPLREEEDSAANLRVQWTDGFSEGIAIISDGTKSHLINITQINPNTGNSGNSNASFTANRGVTATDINYPANRNWPSSYDVGSWIFQAKLVSFRILHDDPDHPTLGIALNYNPNMAPADAGRNYFPLVNDVEDFQCAYILEDGTAVNEPADDEYDDVVSIRLTIVARTREPIRGFAGSAPLDIEDHDVTNTGDNYQRRVLTEEILVRNFQL